MLRILFILILLPFVGFSQLKTDAQLTNDLNNLIPNNTSQLIKPVHVRTVIQQGYDSRVSMYGETGILGKLTYASLFSFSDPKDIVNKKYVDDAVAGFSGGVSSFNSRTGVITPLSTDYSAYYESTLPTSGNPAFQYLRGDKTWQPINTSTLGLGNVDNTSDANKPVSTATQTALNAKQNSLGYTAANDADVVHKTGAETVNGVKTFGNAIRLSTPQVNGSDGQGLLSWQITSGTARIYPTFLLADGADAKPTLGFFPQGGNADLSFSPSTGKWLELRGQTILSYNGTSQASSTATQRTSYKLGLEGSFWTGAVEAVRKINIYNKASTSVNDLGSLQIDWENTSLFNINSLGEITANGLSGTDTRVVEADLNGKITATSRRNRTLLATVYNPPTQYTGSTDADYGAYTIPAGLMAKDGDAIKLEVTGQLLAPAGVNSLAGYFNGTYVFSKTFSGGSTTRSASLFFTVIRTSNTTAVIHVPEPANGQTYINTSNGDLITRTGLNFTSNTYVIKAVMAGDGTSSGAALAAVRVTFEPAP